MTFKCIQHKHSLISWRYCQSCVPTTYNRALISSLVIHLFVWNHSISTIGSCSSFSIQHHVVAVHAVYQLCQHHSHLYLFTTSHICDNRFYTCVIDVVIGCHQNALTSLALSQNVMVTSCKIKLFAMKETRSSSSYICMYIHWLLLMGDPDAQRESSCQKILEVLRPILITAKFNIIYHGPLWAVGFTSMAPANCNNINCRVQM
jgi:hypothetical protein